MISLFLLPRRSCPAPGCPCAMPWSTWLVKMSSTLYAGNLISHSGVGTRWRQDRHRQDILCCQRMWKGRKQHDQEALGLTNLAFASTSIQNISVGLVGSERPLEERFLCGSTAGSQKY